MLEDHQMGSQTLEILRQGVWASLTGGWFYDPHQDVFCNTFHLYVWLFLLCLPFSVYVYLPPNQYVWFLYCGSVTLVLMLIKLLNYGFHHMYDTTECIQEEVDSWRRIKREEDIELQILPTKPLNQPSTSGLKTLAAAYAETTTLHSTDAESLVSIDIRNIDTLDRTTTEVNSIHFRADVHRKNSSESSEDLPSTSTVEVVTHGEPPTSNSRSKRHEKRTKHQRSKTDGCVTFTIKDEKELNANYKKLFQQDSSTDSQENGLLMQHQPSLQSVESEQWTSNFTKEGPRRHSNFTNSSLNFLSSSSIQANIKPTGSLELGYIDKNPNQALTSEGLYFKANNKGAGVRRIRSTVLETCCPLPSLMAHPNSLELIGCKSTRNPLPPPSTSLIRNQHLNLCPYYGSEIVYPIAEQSDEHQTSHGPDTDLESLTRESDSDFEDNNQGSHSPLIYIKSKKPKNVPYTDKYHPKPPPIRHPDEERISATSKDALLDNDVSNSNSSVTPDMQDARVDCYATDNDLSDKKSSECSHLSSSSTSVESVDRSVNKRSQEHSDNKFESNDQQFPNCRIVRKKNIKRNKRKKSLEKRKPSVDEKFSSLMELDLDWLFEDENHCLQHRKEPLKRETEWSSTTTVSLEHDVSKVLQEPMPSTRSLGAIPKKPRNTQSDLRKPPKSESDKCTMCRSKPDNNSEDKRRNRSIKENKVTQTLKQNECSVDGLECIVSSPKHNSSRTNLRSSCSKDSHPPHVELNTLLPAEPLLSAFLNSRRTEYSTLGTPNEQIRPFSRVRLKRISRINRRRSSQLSGRDNSGLSHGARGGKNSIDTADGPVHCFLDEHGNWWVYKGDEKGEGASSIIIDARCRSEHDSDRFTLRRRQSDTSATSSRTVKPSTDLWITNSTDEISSNYVDVSPNSGGHNQDVSVRRARIHPSTSYTANPEINPRLRRSLFRNHSIQNYDAQITDKSLISIVNEPVEPPMRNRVKIIPTADLINTNHRRTKTYYKFKLTPWTYVKVTLDRLKLLALLDRNLTITETVSSIVLGSLVSVLGAKLLYCGFYEDLSAFVFCFVMASCQYSLLKSVQPDAASPTHGFNRVIAYSRPIYFCISSVLILVLDMNIIQSTKEFGYNLNMPLSHQQILLFSRDFLIKFILAFPVFFSLGLFPQINTFLMYLLEQMDIYIFGGNAVSSLLAAVYCVFRSILAVIVLLGLSYGGLVESKGSQHILFSIFCACLVASSYHLSRSASDPSHIWNIVKRHLWLPDVYHEDSTDFNDIKAEDKIKVKSDTSKDKNNKTKSVKFPSDTKDTTLDEHVDPLPQKLQKTINARLKNDVILCLLIALLVFGIHASTVFTVLQPELSPVLWSIAALLGFFLHYIIPQLRKQLPWLCIARPILRCHEHEQYQTRGPAKIMWFERIYIYFCFFERNILYPLLFLSVITEDSPKISSRYGSLWGSFIIVICGLKCLRSSYSDQSSQYMILVFTALFFKYDYILVEETFLVEYFLMSMVFHKFYELLLKVQFVVTYIAPWQITWGSAFHAFAQPFSVPHSAMLFLQALISAVLSTPLNPFLGSAIFLTSYVRPVKFWERDYNTRRVDHSNTPLSSHLDRNLGADDNNLNSIFYEHLTRSLQHSLCGDLKLGRWGPVNQGDCFVLASDYLNCLVHIIEMGNDLVTFQMRGLEFRGTYCQQREVEAITEGVEENDGCCCCDTGHLPNMLSVNAAFSQRWLAWEVTAAKYILEGYSISDNSAVSMLQVFEFRKVLVSYYVKSIIFYTIRSPKLGEWITNQTITKSLQPMDSRNFVDLDPIFNYNIDEDYDILNSGMTKNYFMQVHGEWINYCVEKSEKNIETGINSPLVLLCFALSLLDRIRNKMGNENKQEILSSDKNAYVQDWLENIDSPHTSFKRNERQKPSEKTKKINILSNIVINKGNEIKEFNNNSIKEDYCPIKRRKSHLENYEAEYVQGDTRNIQGSDEKIQDDAEKVYGDAGKIQDDAEKVYGDAGKIQGDAEKAQSYTENIQSDGDDIQSEDGDNSVKDPLYVLPSSEDSSTSSLENYIEEGSCEGGSIVIPTIPTINWKYEQNEPLRNENQVGVKSVETVKKKHYSDKRNYCFYCEKDVTHFMRHILTWHPSEITVEKIVSLPLKSKARRIALASLRKRGNYIKNRADDNLRPVKRVDCNETAITDDFLPCSYCLGFYKKKSLYRHTKTCPENTDNSKRRQTAQSDGQTTLLMGKILEQDKLLAKELFPRMRADKINAIAKKDMLICKYAYSYIKGRKSKGNLDFVRQNIRRLAKMLDFCRTQDSKVKNLIDILRPINFALIIKAVNYLAHYNSETDVFESPTLAMNFGTLLKKCCDLAYIQLLQIDNTNDQRKDLKILKKLIESQWADEVSAQAALNLNENKWNKSELLPLTSDLKKLNVFLKTSAEISFKKLNTDQDNFNAYTSLKEVVYCQIILLNRRRPGEVAQLKIDKYNDISNTNSGDGNTEFEKCLTETEKILLHSYSRIVIRGKRGRGVPILLSPEMKTHFEYLVSMRNRFVRDNKYVFHSSGQGFLDGTKVLYKYAEKCEVDRPKSISATKLRKHLATITQLLHFNDKDLEQLSRFMGHTLKTHCNVYRLSDNMYQTAKVSKLLLLMTEEGIEQYKGKTLDEIDVDLSPVVEEENLVAILPSDNENLTESLLKNEIADSADEQLPNSKQIKLRKRIVRQNWTEEEKSLIATHFSDHIKNKRAPKQNEVNEFVALYPNFAKRKWTSLKAVVFNMYTNKLIIK